ncbi:MAG TPA: rRNA maturation RNase YbeY [Pyrinomonadaceae bacterium]
MVEVVNRQRKTKIPKRDWSVLANRILERIGKKDSTATIAFVSDDRIRQLNRRYRALDSATDVLSFPAGQDDVELGDIAISVERAKVQGRQNGLTLEQEIAQLILHGLLHLCGYDHETDNGEMNSIELKLRRELGI